MMNEAELRGLRERIRKAIRYSTDSGASRKSIEPLARVAVTIEWILEMGLKDSDGVRAALFSTLANIEGLQRADERSQLQ